MRVKKSAPKKLSTPPENIQLAISTLRDEAIPLSTALLDQFMPTVGKLINEKGDLFHWVPVLDRFDSALQQLAKELCFPNESGTSVPMAVGVLSFSRSLIENCSNKSVYNSFEHVNQLLLATDLRVTIAATQLLSVFSHRFGRKFGRGAFALDSEILKTLSRVPEVDAKNGVFSFSFYPTEANPSLSSESSPKREKLSLSSASSLVTIEIKDEQRQAEVLENLGRSFESLEREFSIPKERRFEFFHALRQFSICRSKERDYSLLPSIRLFSLALLASSRSVDSGEWSDLMRSEGSFLLKELATLAHLKTFDVTFSLRNAALVLMEALARGRVNASDVLDAIAFDRYSGVFSSFLRFCKEQEGFYLAADSEYINNLFHLVSFLMSTNAANATLVISSGVVSLMLDLVVKNEGNLQLIGLCSKCIGLLDAFLYSFPTIFTHFQALDGVSIVVEEINKLVTREATESASFPTVTQYLKSLLKLILHLMQSAGTIDGLRSLIETSLPDTLIKIICAPSRFGNCVYAQCIAILATFVNNEPTTLNILLEMSVPQILLERLCKEGIPASHEILNVLPHALGAICLNSVGLALVNQSNIIAQVFEMFTRRDCLRMFQETEAPTSLGSAMDELIRHHPSLRSLVFTCVFSVFNGIDSLSKSLMDSLPDSIGDLSGCVLLSKAAEEQPEVAMISSTAAKSSSSTNEPLIPQMIEIFSVFLESFLLPPSNRISLVEAGGVSALLRFYCLESITMDFATSIYSFSLFHVFKILTEELPIPVTEEIFKQLSLQLDRLDFSILPFSSHPWKTSLFYPSLAACSQLEEVSKSFQLLVIFRSCYGLIGLIRDIHAARHSASRIADAFADSFDTPSTVECFQRLWKLYCGCAWELHLLRQTVPSNWLITRKKCLEAQSKEAASNSQQLIPDPSDRRIRNYRGVKFLLTQIPSAFIPISCKVSEAMGEAARRSKNLVTPLLVTPFLEAISWVEEEAPGLVLDYLNVLIGHVSVLCFDSSNGENKALTGIDAIARLLSGTNRFSNATNSPFNNTVSVNVATLENLVFSNSLEKLVSIYTSAVTKTDESRAAQCAGSFLGFAAKVANLELLKSLDFVHSSDSQFIRKLRDCGMSVVANIWYSPRLFSTLSDVAKNFLFCGLLNLLFTQQKVPSSSVVSEEPSLVQRLIDIGVEKDPAHSVVEASGNNLTTALVLLATGWTDSSAKAAVTSDLYNQNKIKIIESFPARLGELLSDSELPSSCISAIAEVCRVIFSDLSRFLDIRSNFSESQAFQKNFSHLECEILSSSDSQVLPYAEKIAIALRPSNHSDSDVSLFLWKLELVLSKGVMFDFQLEAILSLVKTEDQAVALLRCVLLGRHKDFRLIFSLLNHLSKLSFSSSTASSIYCYIAILFHRFLCDKLDKDRFVGDWVKQKYPDSSALFIVEHGEEFVWGAPEALEKLLAEKFSLPLHPESRQVEDSIDGDVLSSILEFLFSFFSNSSSIDKVWKRFLLLWISELLVNYRSRVMVWLEANMDSVILVLDQLARNFISYPRLLSGSTQSMTAESGDCGKFLESFFVGFHLACYFIWNDCELEPSSQLFHRLLFKRIHSSFLDHLVDRNSRSSLGDFYSSMQGYCDFYSRLLTSKATPSSRFFVVSLFIKEKVGDSLASLLEIIDPNYPKASILVTSVLRLVETLSRAISKFSTLTSRLLPEQKKEQEVSSQLEAANPEESSSLASSVDSSDVSNQEDDFGYSSVSDEDENSALDSLPESDVSMIDDEQMDSDDEDDEEDEDDADDESQSEETDSEEETIAIRSHNDDPFHHHLDSDEMEEETSSDQENDTDMDEVTMDQAREIFAPFLSRPFAAAVANTVANATGATASESAEIDIMISRFDEDEDDESEQVHQTIRGNDEVVTRERRLRSSRTANSDFSDFPLLEEEEEEDANDEQDVDGNDLSMRFYADPFDGGDEYIAVSDESRRTPWRTNAPATISWNISTSGAGSRSTAIRVDSSFTFPSFQTSPPTLPLPWRSVGERSASDLENRKHDPTLEVDAFPLLLVPSRWRQELSMISAIRGQRLTRHYDVFLADLLDRAKQNVNQLPENDPSAVELSSTQVEPSPPEQFIDQGIEGSFLEAIPVDLRIEVLHQHFAQRSANAPPASRIVVSDNYLLSLPPDLRSLYVQESERDLFTRNAVNAPHWRGSFSRPGGNPLQHAFDQYIRRSMNVEESSHKSFMTSQSTSALINDLPNGSLFAYTFGDILRLSDSLFMLFLRAPPSIRLRLFSGSLEYALHEASNLPSTDNTLSLLLDRICEQLEKFFSSNAIDQIERLIELSRSLFLHSEPFSKKFFTGDCSPFEKFLLLLPPRSFFGDSSVASKYLSFIGLISERLNSVANACVPNSVRSVVERIIFEYSDCSGKSTQSLIVNLYRSCSDEIFLMLHYLLDYKQSLTLRRLIDVDLAEPYSDSSFDCTSSSQLLLLIRLVDSLEFKGDSQRQLISSLLCSCLENIWNRLDPALLRLQIPSLVGPYLPLLEGICLGVAWINQPAYTQKFLSFAEVHRKLLNHLMKTNPSLLSGSFSLLLGERGRIVDFDNKRAYFRSQLRKRSASQLPPSTLNLTIRREAVFEDTFQRVMSLSGEEFRTARLSIRFSGEEGVDAGGVAREFYTVLARQIFNPDYALFRTSASDRITYQPNRASWVNPDHLLYFTFVGRIIGKAIWEGRLMDCYFTRSFYKHIIGASVDYRDMQAVDPEMFTSMQWMLDHDITNILDHLVFAADIDDFGRTQQIELMPGGKNIAVTESNKTEYIRLLSELKLTTAISSQIKAFLTGLHDVIPPSLLALFNEQEIELLISGMPDVDVDDWRNNTLYEGGYSAVSLQIQWFWRAVRSFDSEERAKLLQFTTGTSKVPLEGFSHLQGNNGVLQRFQIHRDFSETPAKRLPSAHTCFNQLDLPMYESYEDLRRNLLVAINECSTGFGFA